MSIIGNPVTAGGSGDVYEIFTIQNGWKEATGTNDYAMPVQDYKGPHFDEYAAVGNNGVVFSKDCILDISFGTKTCHDTRRAQTFVLKRVRGGVTETLATAQDTSVPAIYLSKVEMKSGDILYGTEYNAYNMRTARYFVAYIINP